MTTSHVVTPLAGLRAALGTRDAAHLHRRAPATGAFTSIPSAYLSAPYPTPGNPLVRSATLTVPQTGTYELAYTEPPIYIPVTLTLDGRAHRRQPGHPAPGHLHGDGAAHRRPDLHAGRPGAAAHLGDPRARSTSDISQAVAAARRATTAVVVVGDGQESEAADRVNLTLPSDQNQLIDAVAAVNRHTVVVIDAGGPVVMPWLGQVSSVLDAWYPGQTDGTALAAVLFGAVDPSGHLPMTFPTDNAQDPGVRAPPSSPASSGTVDYSEGVDVGYRWYDATGTTPLFPFGFGLSYTTFRYGDPDGAGHGHGTVGPR